MSETKPETTEETQTPQQTEPANKVPKTDQPNTADDAPQTVDAQTAAKILKQVEFYFGDVNFARDKFMQAERAKNPDRYVKLSVLLTFNRLKEFTTDVSVLAECIAESDVVELNEDKTMLRRKVPLDATKINIDDRVVFVKTFPDDMTWEQISEFWEEKVGPVAATWLRRRKDKSSTGTALVTFEKEEDAKKALAGSWKHNDEEISVSTKQEFEAAQEKMREERKEERKQKALAKKEKKNEEDKKKLEEKKANFSFTEGCVVAVTGLGVIENRTTLKEAFEPFGDVKYVDYPNEAESGYIRFAEPDAATAAIEAFADGQREIFGKVATLAFLTGDEEREYHWKVEQSKEERRGSRGRKGSNKRRR